MSKEVLKDWRLYVFGGLFLFNLVFALAYAAPSSFPSGEVVTLERGAGLAEIAGKLERQNVVRSALWFRMAAILFGGERGIQAGDYHLREPQNGVALAWRMTKGKHGIEAVRITVPEGFTNEKIANLFDERFVNFDKSVFLALAREGYMFPDTYFIQVNVTAGEVIDLFESNFEHRTAALQRAAEAAGKDFEDIITMASVIEAEVQTPEDKVLVSGILWERLRIGMALQVDPAPETYEVRGLPKEPINNPGLISLEAALRPRTSDYLYFLSGKDGKTYYAETLEEHTKNIRERL